MNISDKKRERGRKRPDRVFSAVLISKSRHFALATHIRLTQKHSPESALRKRRCAVSCVKKNTRDAGSVVGGGERKECTSIENTIEHRIEKKNTTWELDGTPGTAKDAAHDESDGFETGCNW